ncbi:MAG: hypothetical protein V1798_00730 [Pseudomonadota bacterium]
MLWPDRIEIRGLNLAINKALEECPVRNRLYIVAASFISILLTQQGLTAERSPHSPTSRLSSPRIVPVNAFLSEGFADVYSNHPKWKKAETFLKDYVFEDLNKKWSEFDIQFRLRRVALVPENELVRLTGDADGVASATFENYLWNQAPNGGISIFFDKGGHRLHDHTTPFGRVVIIVRAPIMKFAIVNDYQVANAVMHEVGHLFGAFHVADRSLMDQDGSKASDPNAMTYSEYSRQIVRLNRNYDLERDPKQMSLEAVRQMWKIFLAAHEKDGRDEYPRDEFPPYRAYLSQALRCRFQKRFDQAVSWCQDAEKLYPDGGVAALTLGQILQDMGQFSNACEQFERVKTMKSVTDDLKFSALYHEAITKCQMGDQSGAISTIQEGKDLGVPEESLSTIVEQFQKGCPPQRNQ